MDGSRVPWRRISHWHKIGDEVEPASVPAALTTLGRESDGQGV